MRTWFGSILFVVLATFAVASGCGSKPEVVNGGDNPDLDASVGGGSSGSTGTGANGGGLVLGADGGDGGMGSGCQSSCEDLKANCGFVSDTICGGVVQCGTCPKGEFCGGDGPSRCGVGMSGEGGLPELRPEDVRRSRLHLRPGWRHLWRQARLRAQHLSDLGLDLRRRR